MPRFPFPLRGCFLPFAPACLVLGLAAAEAAEPVEFAREIQPILERHCGRCHGSEQAKAGLNLASLPLLQAGGESGAVIVPGKPEESLLLQRMESGEMPPEGEPRPTPEELARLRRWIRATLPADTAAGSRGFNQHDVLPILLLRCASCHGRQTQEGGFDVRSRASLVAGGKSGPALIPGDPEASLLIRRIAAGEMPPKARLAAASVKPMEPAELERLRAWIAQGAPEQEIAPDVATAGPDPLVSDEDRRFWSFQPPRRTPLPCVADTATQLTDVYIDERLAAAGLTRSPVADRRTLLRRVTVDLWGLPPDLASAEEFDADLAPDAYDRLLDRLLASPRYGERWGQFWLDLAGYSDSEGIQDSDLVRPHAWRYRDYVIRALNADKPYDRFLLEQLAGDELADYESAPQITPELYDNLVATGFLRMSADGTFSGITGFVPDRLDVIDDQLRILGSAVLGLTIGCARCHSHKFDPFPQRDYYRLAAVFKGALDEHDWLKPTRQSGPAGSADRYLPYVLPEERAAWEAGEQRLQQQLAALQGRLAAAGEDAPLKEKLAAEIKSLEQARRPEPLIRALWDRGLPSPTYVLQRGDYLSPGRLVGPGVPAVLTDGRSLYAPQPPWPGAQKTGRRLAFARWLTQPQHPLTARVLVNRVWHHHFGQGIVESLDNFGRAGSPPSHPELLDALAVGFMEEGWSWKRLHRRLLLSGTYRQGSQVTPSHALQDADNRLLSRYPVRRLDAESLQDHLAALAGRLDLRPYGPPDPVVARPDGLVTPASVAGVRRRSIFLLQRRTQPLTLLADFDRPAMNPNCFRRTESTVAPQALHLLNNADVQALSSAFAERVWGETGPDLQACVNRVHEYAYGQSPSREERDLAEQALEELRAAWRRHLGSEAPAAELEADRRALENYCHAVVNSAGLLFVD